jgi:aryl-alcohol dehydrogenase-like predicted oxidoreductase
MAGSGPGYGPEHIAVAEQMEALGQKWDHTPGNLALAWLLSRPTIASAIIGPETVAELEENVRAVDVQLDASQMAELDEVGKRMSTSPFSGFRGDPMANITPASGL